ncbi:MAG: glycosyltransferase, partial [Calditrichaeota bacterium]
MSEKSTPVFSIILVTYNSEDSIAQSIHALKSAELFDSCETIIVDNASQDETISVVKSIIPDCKIIRQKHNLGFAKACNLGALESTGKYLLFYNPDLEIDNDALVKLVDFLDTTENSGAVSGRMRFPDGRFQATCRRFPNMQNIFLSRGSFL